MFSTYQKISNGYLNFKNVSSATTNPMQIELIKLPQIHTDIQ